VEKPFDYPADAPRDEACASSGGFSLDAGVRIETDNPAL